MFNRSRIAEIIYQLSLKDQLYGVGRVWYYQLSEAIQTKVPEKLPLKDLSEIFLGAFPHFVLVFPEQPFFLVYYQARPSARERWLERNQS